MPVSDAIGEAILAGKTEAEIVAVLRGEGFGSLLANAGLKLQEGITSPHEIVETLISEE